MSPQPPIESDRAPTRDLLDPRRLLVFGQVARSGSLAAAAQALGWTQPAVSAHIRRLERDTGCALVVRSARGVSLTEAGRALAQHAYAVAARLRAAQDDLAALADLRAGRVRLAAFPSACATIVPAALAHLHAQAPALDVRLTEAEPPQARQLLADGDVDLVISFSYADVLEEPSRLQLKQIALVDDAVLLVLPDGHRLAGDEDVALADVVGERWIAGCPQCRAHLLAATAAEGFVPDIRHSTDDYVVTQKLVAAGLGVALLPALAVQAARDPGVALVRLIRNHPRRVRLEHPADLPVSPAAAALIATLIETTSRR